MVRGVAAGHGYRHGHGERRGGDVPASSWGRRRRAARPHHFDSPRLRRPPDGGWRRVAQPAAGRWSLRHLRANLPDQPDRPASGACEDAAPALREPSTTCSLLVSIDSIDGRGASSAPPPCVLRDGDARSPAVGVRARLSAEPVGPLVADGQAATVVVARDRHVLGIGTLWYGTAPSVLTADLRGPDPRFTNARGHDEREAPRSAYTDDGEGVPARERRRGRHARLALAESRYGTRAA
jgi:hypothetical protein